MLSDLSGVLMILHSILQGCSVHRNVARNFKFLLNHRRYRLEITCGDHGQKRAATSRTTDGRHVSLSKVFSH